MSYPDTLPGWFTLRPRWSSREERLLIPQKWRPEVPRLRWASNFRPLDEMLCEFHLCKHPRLLCYGDDTPVGLVISPGDYIPEWDIQALRDELWRRWDMHLIEIAPIYDPSNWSLVVNGHSDDMLEALK